MAKLRKLGKTISPVRIEGRAIARTFWGKAWCDHLETYSDHANRLPRGRSYARNGSIVDLQIGPGAVTALVQGSSMYRIRIGMHAVEKTRWQRVVGACTGKIDSIVELLAGKLSGGVMEVLTSRDAGLFPDLGQIVLGCSCPDSATMCKHVAAVLYGVGARLDAEPELLFVLRSADPAALITQAAAGSVLQRGRGTVAEKAMRGADLSSVFGIEMDDLEGPESAVDALPMKNARVATRRAGEATKARAAAKAPLMAAPRMKARGALPAAEKAPVAGTIPARKTLDHFRRLGVPDETMDYWVRTGALGETGQAGVYDVLVPARLGKYARMP